jgi:hypothetical protein
LLVMFHGLGDKMENFSKFGQRMNLPQVLSFPLPAILMDRLAASPFKLQWRFWILGICGTTSLIAKARVCRRIRSVRFDFIKSISY